MVGERALPADEGASSCILVLTLTSCCTEDSAALFCKHRIAQAQANHEALSHSLPGWCPALQSNSGHLLLDVLFCLPEASLSIGMEPFCTTSPWGTVPSKWTISSSKWTVSKGKPKQSLLIG